MKHRLRFILILPAIFVIIVLAVFLFVRHKTTTDHYDFIAGFFDAEKSNFDENVDLDSFMPDKHLTLVHSFLLKEFATLFSFNTVPLIDKGKVIDNNFQGSIDGAYRLTFNCSEKEAVKFALDLKDQGNGNKWTFTADASKGICRVEIARFVGDKKTVEDSFDYPIEKNFSNVIVLAFFEDFLLVFSRDTILYQQKSEALRGSGKSAFHLLKAPSSYEGISVKFAVMGNDLKKRLLNSIYSGRKDVPEHKFNLKDEDWSGLSTHYNLDISGKKNTYLRRIKLRFETRPALFFRLNSSLKYKLRIPNKAVLDFCLAAVPKYINDIGRLRFYIEVENLSGKLLLKKEIDLSSFKDPYETFNPVKMDLSALEGEDVRIQFSASTSDGKLSKDEDKILVAMASPSIYVKRDDERLNVILISLDALRQDHIGAYGYKRNTTPNIDKITAESTLFMNAITAANWTIPSHMTIMTGLYPMEVGFISGGLLNSESFIADNVYTLADYLRNRGYYTLGVHGGGYMSEFYGFDKGFCSYIKGSKDIAEGVQTIIRNLEKQKNNNFFLFFHTLEIHWPYTHDEYLKELPPDASLQEQIMARYDSGIKYADKYLGKLFDWLESNHIMEKTVIIIISDHGETFRLVKANSKSGSHGSTVYEEEIKIPMIVKIPSVDGKGRKEEYQVATVDILPTILDCLGMEPLVEVRGTSLLPLIEKNKSLKPRLAYVESTHSPEKFQVIRSNEFKLITTSPSYLEMMQGKQSSYRFIDIINDPKEINNVWDQHAPIAKSYRDFLHKLLASIRENVLRLHREAPGANVSNKELEEQLRGLGYVGN